MLRDLYLLLCLSTEAFGCDFAILVLPFLFILMALWKISEGRLDLLGFLGIHCQNRLEKIWILLRTVTRLLLPSSSHLAAKFFIHRSRFYSVVIFSCLSSRMNPKKGSREIFFPWCLHYFFVYFFCFVAAGMCRTFLKQGHRRCSACSDQGRVFSCFPIRKFVT